ncbi:MAG: hypothetical protein ACLRP3_09960 [Escherichia sp.]
MASLPEPVKAQPSASALATALFAYSACVWRQLGWARLLENTPLYPLARLPNSWRLPATLFIWGNGRGSPVYR